MASPADQPLSRRRGERLRNVLQRALYMLAVLAISLGILYGVVMYLASRDSAPVDGGGQVNAPATSQR
ncbi:MAG: hypothetical protein NVSMB51_18290 [Solirubrobacteraceae bacterium]